MNTINRHAARGYVAGLRDAARLVKSASMRRSTLMRRPTPMHKSAAGWGTLGKWLGIGAGAAGLLGAGAAGGAYVTHQMDKPWYEHALDWVKENPWKATGYGAAGALGIGGLAYLLSQARRRRIEEAERAEENDESVDDQE